jgi:hypothetical protein
MRTIKTYFKGAPFYIASSYRRVGFSAHRVANWHFGTPNAYDSLSKAKRKSRRVRHVSIAYAPPSLTRRIKLGFQLIDRGGPGMSGARELNHSV